IINEKNRIEELIVCFKNGSDVEKGTCAHVMKIVSANDQEIFKPYIFNLIEYINYKAPRVKWGIPETIGNLAKKYPKEVGEAIPKLMLNTADKSTVVRWCAAFALTEIAKYNFEKQKKLISEIKELVKKEDNKGVKNLYLRALKTFKEIS
ncbi:MAG: hypothetical protein JXA91_02815, partial [Candidatus Thermoplasmatota archaeon]|nr:hypothetical protein [Candidatus Thermoplasmatota archaeon]